MFIGSETTSFLNILFSELSKTNTVTVVSQYPIQKSKRVKNVKYKTINSKNKFIFFIKTLFLTLNLKAFDINNVSSISLNRNFLVKNNLWKLVNIIQPDIIHIQFSYFLLNSN